MTLCVGVKASSRATREALKGSLRALCMMFVSLFVLSLMTTADALAQGGTGQVIDIYSESFDGVAAPALPAGWTTSTTGGGVAFATAANAPDTSPNAAQATLPATAGSSVLLSPVIQITAPRAVLSFRHSFNTEAGWDGGTFDIIVNGQPYSYYSWRFLANGFNSSLRGTDNPLAGSGAWSGNSNGYITTLVELPQLGENYNVQLRWTAAHDSGFGEGKWQIDSVSITGSFSATNSNAITIPNNGAASPYPSEIEINGYSGAVQQVVVRLHNFSHAVPDDVDLMLVAPNGRKMILMSDVGGSNSVSNVTLTFDDAAANFLPDEGTITTGTYKPSNYGSDRDAFPAPAPSGGTTGATLSTFFGGYPNGTYKLFLVDDNWNNVGSVSGGWSISLRTSLNICSMSLAVVPYVYSAAGGNGTLQITTQAGCAWSLGEYAPFLTLTSPSSGAGSTNVNFTVGPNTTGGYRSGWFNILGVTRVSYTSFQQNPN